MSRPEITFFKSFREFGALRLAKSPSLWIAILAVLGYWYYKIYNESCGKMQTDFASILVSTSAGLFSILFAAFAIIIALSDKDFVVFLRKSGKLNNILFPFWLISFLYLLSIATNLIAIIAVENISIISAILGIFFFTFAIAETFYLVSTTVKFGLYRAEIYSALAELREAQVKKEKAGK